jgi:metal-sulfur cluster biosynthetic enzyme
MSVRAAVFAALDGVYDPELDEPITALGFVGSCAVSPAGDVDVVLRLPTPQCAPNFAWLMVSDARERVLRAPGVGAVSVVLEDHYTGEEINAAAGRGADFADAFPGETTGDVQALRELFRRKALLARQGRVCDELLADGAAPGDVVGLRVAALPASPDVARCLALRRELGLAADAAAPALVAGDGAPIPLAELDRWRRRARLVGVSLESNGGICRSLLASRYDDVASKECAVA